MGLELLRTLERDEVDHEDEGRDLGAALLDQSGGGAGCAPCGD